MTPENVKSFQFEVKLFQDGNQFFENKFDKFSVTIGREDGVDLVIQDKSISRKHLVIEYENSKMYVTDLGSSNGTYVDNQKITKRTEVKADSHVRAGKITLQIIPPAIKIIKIEDLELSKPGKIAQGQPVKNKVRELEKSPSQEEVPELTLSKIAFQVEAAIAAADLKAPAEHHDTEEIYAMVDKNFIQEMTKQHASSTTYPSKKIETLVLWNGQIYKVQEFGPYDTIAVGPTYDDAIHIPSVPFRWSLSNYDFQEAIFQIPKNLNVFAIRGQHFLSKQQLMAEKRIKETQSSLQIQISHYDVLRVEIDANTQLYCRYVPSAVELDTKKMFNPDVLVKKALKVSFFFHLILCILLLLIPKEKIQAPPKKAPERIAKLLVEPKPVPIPPPVEEKKEEPPPPPPEEKKEEPPPPPKKVEPPKPKPIPKKLPPPKKEPIPEPEPDPEPEPVIQKAPPKPISQPVVQQVQKPAGNPQADNKPSAPAPKNTPVAVQPKPAPPAPPPPKPVDISKLGALAAIGGLKLDAKSNKAVPTNVNIAANTNTNTGAEVGTTSITNELKSQTAGIGASNSSNASGPIKTKGNSTGGSGYGTAGLGTGTGKRGVKGGVVGQPALTTGSGNGRTEGLSREQVLKAMQPFLGKIQSCYERSLLSDPNLSGRIEFEWNIASSGSVKSVDIKKNSVAGGEQLGDCVSGVIRSIKFPSASNGEETNPSVGFPFGRL